MNGLIGSKSIKGKCCCGYVYPGGVTLVPDMDPITQETKNIALPGRWEQQTDWEDNLTLFDWGIVNGQLLRGLPDGRAYHIGGLYIEFENNSGAAVTPPTFDRTGSKDYYDALSGSGTIDYLRIPLTASTMVDPGYAGSGRIVTFFAQTEGVAGVHGKTYSDAVQSRVFGAALVAFPVADDTSLDIVHSRVYYAADKQLIKQVGSQIMVTWPLTLN